MNPISHMTLSPSLIDFPFPSVYITAEKPTGELLHFELTWPEGFLETAADALGLGYSSIAVTLFEEVAHVGGFRCRSFVWQYVG